MTLSGDSHMISKIARSSLVTKPIHFNNSVNVNDPVLHARACIRHDYRPSRIVMINKAKKLHRLSSISILYVRNYIVPTSQIFLYNSQIIIAISVHRLFKVYRTQNPWNGKFPRFDLPYIKRITNLEVHALAKMWARSHQRYTNYHHKGLWLR